MGRTMDGDLDELKRISREILNPEKTLTDLIPEAETLRDLFERKARFCIDNSRDLAAGESRLGSGLAISPTLAAMCIRELFRTTAFIRGLGAAIRDSMHLGRPVRVLYAGCGPYALLAVPLMAAFTREQVRFTLLDIHQECLDKALTLIASFGLTHYVDGSVCADATLYRIPEGEKPDVIVSETMAVCLHNEPQVSIARHLLAQAPDVRMVPQSVSVEACLLDLSREHVIMPAGFDGEFPQPERDRIYLGKVFELDAANIRCWEGLAGGRLPAGQVKIPARMESRYQPYLLTRIEVYGENRLQDYDCSLTPPQPLRGRIEGGETLQFHYRLGNNPQLCHEIVAP